MPIDNPTVYAVLLAGGTGTRLWPVSRERFPKQLVKFIGNDSLVQSTVKRLPETIDTDNIRIVCGTEHFHEIKRHMSEIDIPPEGKLICEPCGRNTAPAILLAAFHIRRNAGDAVMCIFPADHVIRDINDFHDKIATAVTLAQAGNLVTFGIQPGYPETGYGYIEGGAAVSDVALKIARFVEKPDKKTAETYLSAGNFFWNSGMFAFRVSTIIREFAMLAPDLFEKMEKMTTNTDGVSLEDYQSLPDIAIDVAIMEKTEKGVVVPSDFGWSDIGSWKSLYDFLEKDDQENVLDGDVIAEDTKNCFIMGGDRLIATNHLRNMVVVETPDSIFVSNLDNSRDVKEIVTKLKASGRKEFRTHRTAHHPWGTETVLDPERKHKTHRMVIYPGETLQLESKTGRIHHLAAVQGTAETSSETDSVKTSFGTGEFRTIAPGDTLRIHNPGTEEFVLISISIEHCHEPVEPVMSLSNNND
jgi:mannose-1-phosphate guanylyltransferase/mannose-6-phosphate isomerase